MTDTEYVSYNIQFVYYTDQRMTAEIDIESSWPNEFDIVKDAWELLTRNWEKPASYVRATVKRIS